MKSFQYIYRHMQGLNCHQDCKASSEDHRCPGCRNWCNSIDIFILIFISIEIISYYLGIWSQITVTESWQGHFHILRHVIDYLYNIPCLQSIKKEKVYSRLHFALSWWNFGEYRSCTKMPSIGNPICLLFWFYFFSPTSSSLSKWKAMQEIPGTNSHGPVGNHGQNC